MRPNYNDLDLATGGDIKELSEIPDIAQQKICGYIYNMLDIDTKSYIHDSTERYVDNVTLHATSVAIADTLHKI